MTWENLLASYEEERNGSSAENLIKPEYHHDLFLSYKGLLIIMAKTIKIYVTGQSETLKRTTWSLNVYARGKNFKLVETDYSIKLSYLREELLVQDKNE